MRNFGLPDKPEINEILPSLIALERARRTADECWKSGRQGTCAAPSVAPAGSAAAAPAALSRSRLQRPARVRLRESSAMSTHADVFVIGAGPAGLTAAYCLTRENPSIFVIEKDPVYVGGISRTVEYNGF